MNLLQREFGSYENRDGFRRLVGLGVFFGMLAFSLYFLMQTLSQSALTDEAPYFMRPSYFSTATLYLAVSYVGFLIHFSGRFERISFAEVYDNGWYCLTHLGYSVGAMVMAKLLAQIASAFAAYTAGFLTTLLLSSVLKFPLVASFLLSQYLLGLVNAVTLLVLTLLLSMLVRDRAIARSWLAFMALGLFALQFPSGFYAVATDREAMSAFGNLWTRSWYLWAVTGCAALSMLICIRRGSHLARMFNPPVETGAPVLSGKLVEGVRVAVETGSGSASIRRQAKRLEAAYLPARRFNLPAVLVGAALVVVIASMLLVNLTLLAFSYASPEKETSVMGCIPYVFQSTTMEPAVRYNDIAFFEKVDQYVQVSPGDIVLYKDDVDAVQVRKILDFYADPATGETYADADITNYVEGARKDALKTTLARSQIYGRLVGANRSLGVVVLFANTMFGRLLFLVIPTVLIFFSGPIFGFLRRGRRKNR